MTEGLDVAGQAERLGVSEELIRAIVTKYLQEDLQGDELTEDQVNEIDDVLNRDGILLVPGFYGYTGEDV